MQSDTEVREQILATLERLNKLVSTKDLQVLSEFANSDDIFIIGSDAGEVARGRLELRAFFERIFARDASFSWEWCHVDISFQEHIAWLFAEGHVILSTPKGHQKRPYRITGVLEREDGRWVWRQYHGNEPLSGE